MKRYKRVAIILTSALVVLGVIMTFTATEASVIEVGDFVFVCEGEHSTQMGTVVKQEGGLLFIEDDDSCFCVEPKNVEVID